MVVAKTGRRRQAEDAGEFHLMLGLGQQEHILLRQGSPARNSSTAQLLVSRTRQTRLSETPDQTLSHSSSNSSAQRKGRR